MKKFLAVMSVLVLTVSLLAKPTNRPNQLEKNVEEKIVQVQTMQSENTVSPEAVSQELQAAKRMIQQQMEFPVHVQDKSRAGVIFGRLMPLMYSYNKLRRKDSVQSQEIGSVIAKETFVSKDEKEFKLIPFIEEYLGNVTIHNLAREFAEFKEHIRQDAALQ